MTCARKAKKRGVIVPRECIIYDAVTSEHLGRPGMRWLRTELIPQRRIAAVIIPTLGRISCDEHHRLTFEKECAYYGVELLYGDAPSGMDVSRMFARSGMSLGNTLCVKTNRESVLSGNIARVMTGKVPPDKVPFAYRYCCKAKVDSRGSRKIHDAWWEIDQADETGALVWGNPAWIIRNIFNWLGNESRTQYWVASELNKLKEHSPSLFRPLYGGRWVLKMIGDISARISYTGKGVYNRFKKCPISLIDNSQHYKVLTHQMQIKSLYIFFFLIDVK